jgi:SAM-dependent methyltransferase
VTRTPYRDGAAWAAGPDVVYARLAEATAATGPARLDGFRAVDVGAGTGAVSRALRARGAAVVAVDASPSMLAAGRDVDRRIPAVVGDACALPVRSLVADVAVAGFVASHMDDPVRLFAEMGRIVVPGGDLTATAFPADAPPHPVKVAVEDVLAEAGYTAPDWFAFLKGVGEPHVGAPAALIEFARAAGWAAPWVLTVDVPLAGVPVATLAAWRLGMAQVAPFVDALGTDVRAALFAAATDRIASIVDVPALPMLVLRGSVGPGSLAS